MSFWPYMRSRLLSEFEIPVCQCQGLGLEAGMEAVSVAMVATEPGEDSQAMETEDGKSEDPAILSQKYNCFQLFRKFTKEVKKKEITYGVSYCLMCMAWWNPGIKIVNGRSKSGLISLVVLVIKHYNFVPW